jgi:hypothetical protein
VVFDWLEDCLNKSIKPKLLKVKPYTLDRTLARIKKGKMDLEKFRTQFEEGVQAAKELCDNSKPTPITILSGWLSIRKCLKPTNQFVRTENN